MGRILRYIPQVNKSLMSLRARIGRNPRETAEPCPRVVEGDAPKVCYPAAPPSPHHFKFSVVRIVLSRMRYTQSFDDVCVCWFH